MLLLLMLVPRILKIRGLKYLTEAVTGMARGLDLHWHLYDTGGQVPWKRSV